MTTPRPLDEDDEARLSLQGPHVQNLAARLNVARQLLRAALTVAKRWKKECRELATELSRSRWQVETLRAAMGQPKVSCAQCREAYVATEPERKMDEGLEVVVDNDDGATA